MIHLQANWYTPRDGSAGNDAQLSTLAEAYTFVEENEYDRATLVDDETGLKQTLKKVNGVRGWYDEDNKLIKAV